MIKISRTIEKRFEEVTNKKLIKNSFSNFICVNCNSKLSEFSDFRAELIENQVKIQKIVDSTKETIWQRSNPSEIPTPNDNVPQTSKTADSLEEDQVEALNEFFLELKPPLKVTEPDKPKKITNKCRKICQLCGLSFASNGYFHHMLRKHTEEPRFICDFCEKDFRVKHDLSVHLKTHIDRESREKFPCSFCPSVFLSKSAVKNHIHVFHSGIIEFHPCTDCGKVFSSRMKLRQHSIVHKKGHFPCSKCEKVYMGKNALQKHVVKSHGNKKACEICGKLFASGTFMSRHMKSSHGPPEFSCTFESCSKEFHSRSALAYHVESTHQSQKVVYCPTCEAPYTSVRNLNRHIQRQHTNVRVQCEVEGCTHTSARKDYLSSHIRGHRELDEKTKTAILEKVKNIKIIPW